MSVIDLRSDAAFDQLIANVAKRPNYAGKSAREIADDVKTTGGDAGDAAHQMIMAGYSASHAGSWRGVINDVLGLATTDPKKRGNRKAATVSSAVAVVPANAPANVLLSTPEIMPEASSAMPVAVQPSPAPNAPPSAMPSVAGWVAEYRSSAALRQEFASEDGYVALKKHEARQAGQAFDATEPTSTDPDDSFEKEWSADAALQAEFVSAATYAAYRRAEARGNVRFNKGTV